MTVMTPSQLQNALEMLREHYRQTDTTPMLYSGYNTTPAGAVTLFLAAPDVLHHLSRILDSIDSAASPQD